MKRNGLGRMKEGMIVYNEGHKEERILVWWGYNKGLGKNVWNTFVSTTLHVSPWFFWCSLTFPSSTPFLRPCWLCGERCMEMPFIRFGQQGRTWRYCLTIMNHSLLSIFACAYSYSVFVVLVTLNFPPQKQSQWVHSGNDFFELPDLFSFLFFYLFICSLFLFLLFFPFFFHFLSVFLFLFFYFILILYFTYIS